MKNTIINYIKEFRQNYCDEKIINFYSFFTKDDLKIIKKCNIYLEDRLYTEEEFFLIKMQVLTYLDLMEFSQKTKNRIYNLFIKIIETYNLR